MSIDKVSGTSWSSVSKVDGISSAGIANINSVAAPAGSTLLLDTYTGASLAYSFRKLNSSYSGYCIRVQNDSAVNLDVGFSGDYLDTAAIASHCGGGNGRITVWYDQSGNGLNATQASVSAMPTIYSSGSLLLVNSKAAASFDGGDRLITASTQVHTGGFYGTSVIKTPASIGNQQILCQDDANVGTRVRVAQYLRTAATGATGRSVVFNTSVSNFADNSPSISVNTQVQISSKATSTGSIECFANSVSNGTTSYTGTISTASHEVSVGSNTHGVTPGNYFTGSIQEIIVWDGDQSSSRAAIEAEVDTYYSIP